MDAQVGQAVEDLTHRIGKLPRAGRRIESITILARVSFMQAGERQTVVEFGNCDGDGKIKVPLATQEMMSV